MFWELFAAALAGAAFASGFYAAGVINGRRMANYEAYRREMRRTVRPPSLKIVGDPFNPFKRPDRPA